MSMEALLAPPFGAPNADLWYGTSGPPDAEIVIVGESWGAEEAASGKPFVGSSGNEYRRIVAEAGLDWERCLVTNVVAERPYANETWRFFHPKVAPSGKPKIGGCDPGQNVRDGIARLYRQIAAHPRRVIIATGNYSFWALTHQTGTQILRESNHRQIPKDLQPVVPTGIMNWRGSMWYVEPHPEIPSPSIPRTFLLPLIHPAAIQRQWSLRAVTVHDLKARVPMALRGDWRRNPAPLFWAPPTFEQVIGRLSHWLQLADSGTEVWLAEDIETARGFITCLGLADSPNFAMAIPFVRKTAEGFGSWWTVEQEAQILFLLRRINSHPKIRIVGQYFIYDTQYIDHWMAVTPRLEWGTDNAQNVMFPGTPKDLGYLSSLYCQYHWYWKDDAKEWDTRGSVEQLLLYNCEDCIRTWDIAATQRKLIEHYGMEEQWQFKKDTHEFCLRMMKRGVRIDTQRRAQLAAELRDYRTDIERELEYIVPQEMVQEGAKTRWYNSAQQTAKLLYEILGLKVILHRKTGNRTVGKEALDELKRKYPEWGGLFLRLDIHGSVSNTLNVINSPLDPDGRMRCAYGPAGTETHRVNSSKNVFGRGTNFQNLTKGEEDD